MADQQIKALKALIEESDRLIEAAARDGDVQELRTENNAVTFGQRTFRTVDADRVEMILGPELFARVGGSRSITMKAVDELLKKKNTTLTEEQKRDLRSVIGQSKGEPYVVTKPL
jgi:hypothetical protein